MSASLDGWQDAFSERVSKEFRAIFAQSQYRMEIRLLGIGQKLDQVIERQQALMERMDRRISNLASDLATHKADPDAHERGYSVKDDEETFIYP